MLPRPRPDRRTRARPGLVPAAALALGALAMAACRSASASAGPPSVPFASTDDLPAFKALSSALAEEEDELARGMLVHLRARPLDERERELVESAQRVLDGRSLVRALDLWLESEPVPDSETYRLVLVARSGASAPVRLRLPPADLKRFRTHIDARGLEGLDYESKALSALADLELAPTVERRIPLAEYELPLGRALAVRERWRVETRSGEIESGGTRYPAARVVVAGCERERVSPLVAAEATAPGELAELLAAADAPRARDVLQLALLLPVDARAAELDALAPVLADLAERAPDRIAAAEPALRWLTGNRDIGLDAAGWARHLASRTSAAEHEARPAGSLDLPDGPRRTR